MQRTVITALYSFIPNLKNWKLKFTHHKIDLKIGEPRGELWLKGPEDINGFFTLRLAKDPKKALFPASTNSLKIVEIDEIFDKVSLGMEHGPWMLHSPFFFKISKNPFKG